MTDSTSSDVTVATTADLEEHATSKIAELVPDQLDDVTRDQTFHQATASLLAGEITVPEWQWFARRALTKRVNIPYIGEASERGLFDQALEATGALLEGLLLTTAETEIRARTVDLLRGDATVPEWVDAAGVALDAIVDIPYLPSVGEDLLFDRGLTVIADSLHGLLVGGSSAK